MADLEIGGYRIPRGQNIMLWIAAANRDPAQFTNPDAFDIRRSPNRHLSFDTGIHACLGGPLARMEAETIFATLTRRLVDPRLDDDPPPYRLQSATSSSSRCRRPTCSRAPCPDSLPTPQLIQLARSGAVCERR